MTMRWMGGRRRALAVGAAVFLAALVPRIWDSAAFITTDEPAWAHRSAMFLTAFREERYADTLVVGHPGVTTMWLGSLGIAAQCRLEPAACEDLWLVGARQLDGYWAAEEMRRLPRWLPGVKAPLAAAIAVGIAAAALLLGALLGRWVALVGAALMVADPFLIAHSRVMHLDALTALLMTVSLLSLVVGTGGRLRWQAVAASGATATLAALTKSTGLFMAPFAGLTVCFLPWRAYGLTPRAARRILVSYGLWLLAAGATLFLVWPAMWADPAGSVGHVLDTGIGYARAPHENLNYFMGKVRPDPGVAFYPVALLLRLTPLTVLGLVGALALWPRLRAARPRPRTAVSAADVVFVLLAFAVLFTVFMTVGAKKFDRYLLPVFPVLDIVASVGLVAAARALVRAPLPPRLRPAWGNGWARGRVSWARMRVALATTALALVVVVQSAHVFSFHPYYLAYYNPAAGGQERAPDVILVGWGEGLERVASFLNTEPEADRAVAAVWMAASLAPFFEGDTEVFFDDVPGDADYLVFYISDDQRAFHATARERLGDQEPVHVVQIHGIRYASIYRAPGP